MTELFKNITVTIVLYQENYQIISKCLLNLKNFKIIIVDNFGNYKLREEVIKKYKIFKYIINKKNLGFSKGTNQAIKLADTDYVLSIQADCKIQIDDIFKLYQGLRKYENCVIVTPTFYNEKLDLTYSGGPLPEKNIQIKTLNLEGDTCVDIPTTAAILFQKKDLIKIGLFDEDFFIYFPDFELGRRIKKTKKSIIQIFGTKTIHAHGELKVKNFFKKIFFRSYYFTLDELIYYKKTNSHSYKFNKLKKKIPKLFFKSILNLIIFRWDKSTHSIARILAYYKFKKNLSSID